ncbi:MAG: hypothetical protein CO189_01250 [candidate division Zixibacteria bacterium CG_4_9_14_3_um_filter_46_8]|nr:MAG: hypothetical protein CO189_01250 [candidate division Zixibacteria bacterium CG_4_9_14_3_um_filter_46_8]
MGKIYRYNNCIICGRDNPMGFNMDFISENGAVRGKVTPDRKFEGYGGILHGGIVSALLDEAMAKALFAVDIVSVTIGINVRFRKPVKIGQEITVRGEAGSIKKKVAFASGEILLPDGTIAAESEGKFFILEGVAKEQMLGELS